MLTPEMSSSIIRYYHTGAWLVLGFLNQILMILTYIMHLNQIAFITVCILFSRLHSNLGNIKVVQSASAFVSDVLP